MKKVAGSGRMREAEDRDPRVVTCYRKGVRPEVDVYRLKSNLQIAKSKTTVREYELTLGY